MYKSYIFNEVLGDFNEDIIISQKPSALLRALNADMEKQAGTLRKRKGTARLGAQLVDNLNILGLFDFILPAGTRLPLASINASGGATSKVMKYSAAAWADSKTGLTASKRSRFATMVGRVFMTNGEELLTSADATTWDTTMLTNTIAITSTAYADPLVTLTVAGGHGVVAGDVITVAGLAPAGYNGAKTVTAVTATTIVWSEASLGAVTDLVGTFTVNFTLPANDILEYQDAMFLIGLKGYRSDFMYSEIPYKNSAGAYELKWNRQNSATVMTGDGEELIGGIPYRGALYLFKNNSVIKTAFPIPTNGLKPLTKNIGANDRRNILVAGGQLLFFCDGQRDAKKGFYSYNSLADAEPQIISEPMQRYIDGMTAGQKVVSGTVGEMMVSCIGAVTNTEYGLSMTNCILVFNTKTNRWLGAWDYGTPVQEMAQLTLSNVTSNHIGDDDGNVWTTNTGSQDRYIDANSPGNAIELQVDSHIYDIAQGATGARSDYRQRAVKNIWVYGDNLDNTIFRYRFDPVAGQKDGWKETKPTKSPVTLIPVLQTKCYLWQFAFQHIGRNANAPVIRKVVIEYE